MVPDGSSTNGSGTGLGTLPANGEISPNGSFTVRVTMTVTEATSGGNVGVTLGDTTDNTTGGSAANQQNIPDGTDSAAANAENRDVRTIDADGTTTPVNGEREAANSRTVQTDTAPADRLAQATVLKTSSHSDSGTGTNGSDDTIDYSLTLNVGNNTNIPGLAPGNLEGTNISVNRGTGATTENRILVSDVIPADTVFDIATAPTVPTNWEVVYSTDDPAAGNALQVTWTTVRPTNAADIKRVGFIYDTAANSAIAAGAPASTFGFRVITSGLPSSVATSATFQIANIAQAFGTTEGDATDTLVFDESGDQNFNNYNDGVTPTTTATTFDPIADKGVADVTDPDTSGNNNGTTPNGESNVVNITITAIPTSTSPIFNGPSGTPTAVGPVDNNNDFTNVAVRLPTADVGAQGETSGDPPPVEITNTVQNSSATNTLATVTLVPRSLTDAETDASALSPSTNPTPPTTRYNATQTLPDGSVVTIKYETQTAIYSVSGGNFTFTSSTNTPQTNGPVVVGTLTPNQSVNYTVTVDLPGGAAVSTPQVQGFAVPIVAFVDNNNTGAFEVASEKTANITVNRVYNGFMKLAKTFRVQGTREAGPVDTGPTFVDTLPAGFNVIPGDNITYRVIYENISEAATGGGGNVVLSASSFVLTEDGDAGGNTWAGTTVHQNGTAQTAGTVTYSNDGANPTTTDPANENRADPSTVTRYVNNVGIIAPQGSGNLTFIRKIR